MRDSKADQVDADCAAASALAASGIAPGDRVAIVSENRSEWAIADLAIMTAGGITVPAYTTNNLCIVGFYITGV